MAEVGTLEWLTDVKNVAESKRSAENMASNFEGVAEQATTADEAMERVGGTSADVNQSWGKLGRQGAALSGTMSMLTSGAMLLASNLAGLSGFSLGGLLAGGGGSGLLGGLLGGSLSRMLPSIGLGSLLSGMSIRGLLKLIPVVGIGAILGGLVGGELGKLLGHENIGSILGALAGGALALKLGSIGIGAILTKLGLGGLATKLGSVSIGAILTKIGSAAAGAGAGLAGLLGSVGLGTVVGGVGSVMALIGAVASLTDLIDGDISGWNLPAQFGHALGQAIRDVAPDIADTVHDAFTNNPVHDMGSGMRSAWEADTDQERLDAANQLGAASGALPGGFDFTEFQTGGMVEETGPAVLHENEAVLPAKLVDAIVGGSGGGDSGQRTVIENQTIEIGDQQLDLSQLSERDLETLADMIAEKQGTTLSTM